MLSVCRSSSSTVQGVGSGECRKDKRPNKAPAAWRHQNRYTLNEAHMPFDLLFAFFFLAITLLLCVCCAPTLQNGGALQMNVA
jgi:hypothetical protein